MNVRITTDQTLAARLRDLAARTALARAELAERLRTESQRELVRTTPVRTGTLRDGWKTGEQTGSDDVGRSTRSLTNATDYAGFVEYGASRQAPQRVAGRTLARVRTLAAALFRLS